MKPHPLVATLTAETLRILGQSGTDALLAAYSAALSGSANEERLLEVATYPGLPVAYAHDCALRIATIALKRKRDVLQRSVFTALDNKRKWMRGKCTTQKLRDSYEAALTEFQPTSRTKLTNVEAVYTDLLTIVGLAASLPNAPRAVYFSAWAHDWLYQWDFHMRYMEQELSRPKFEYGMGKFRMSMRRYQITEESMQLQDDSEAGVTLQDLCTLIDEKFAEYDKALQAKHSWRRPSRGSW